MTTFRQSLATRLGVAVVRELRRFEELFAYVGGTGDPDDPTNESARIYLTGGGREKSITPPQIHVQALKEPFEPGAGGNADGEYTVTIALLDWPDDSADKPADFTAIDVLEAIKTWLENGGEDENGRGKLVDPAHESDPTKPRYLNDNIREWRYGEVLESLPGNVAVYTSIVGAFETTEDNITGDRY